MDIIILDRYDQRRDLAQMDMYKVIGEYHNTWMADESTYLIHLIKSPCQVLHLGIYHQEMNIDWQLVFEIVKMRDITVLIDQADNEEFFLNYGRIWYQQFAKARLLSRYLPNPSMEMASQDLGIELRPLWWYIDPERVQGEGQKNIEKAMICTPSPDRDYMAKKYPGIIYGQYYGQQYFNLLARTKTFVVECRRKCYTQKYVEALINGCKIEGDKPLYPDVPLTREAALENFCNKEKFIHQYESILVQAPGVDG